MRTAALIVLLLLRAASAAPAQDARVTAKADTSAIPVGGQLSVTVTVDHPAGTVVKTLGPADTLRGAEIVRVDSVAGSGPAGPGPFTRVYVVTAFDTGTVVLPPFTAWYGAPSDSVVAQVTGSPLAFAVRGVDVDTSAEIRAIKPPLGAPITFAELLPYIVGVAIAVLLGWLAYYIMKKRRRGEKIIPAAPPRPPADLAMEALRAIEAERLWQRGLVKEYHSALSDVLRTYIERRYAMPAMESTSDEILSSPVVAALEPRAAASLRDVLTRSDLVKFAKFLPPPEQNERSMGESVSFVTLTNGAPGAQGRGLEGHAASETGHAAAPGGPAEGGGAR